MRKAVKPLLVVAAASVMLLVGTVGSASATCTADSSSGQDPRTGTQIPAGGTALGSGYLDVTGAPSSDSGSIVGILGYAEFTSQQDLLPGSASGTGELNGTSAGYIEDDYQVSGTNVSGSTDGSTSNGAVSGSGELNGTTLNDVQVNSVCLTP